MLSTTNGSAHDAQLYKHCSRYSSSPQKQKTYLTSLASPLIMAIRVFMTQNLFLTCRLNDKIQ
ncbi:hypothetical protein EUZ93_03050 [Wolbachia pipientis]|nr:hypothetical protein [Wolbachia pipientis]